VLLKIITQWFDAGTLEYVRRWHRLPQCILACGSVDKATEPFHRLVTNGWPINVYASAWRVKYITVADLRLMLMQNSLMAVRDLKAAYHLVRYSGCGGDTRYLVRWITNHGKNRVCCSTDHAERLWPGGIAWGCATSLSWHCA
jgi:hypothetical protein